jgi:hypothetical protein
MKMLLASLLFTALLISTNSCKKEDKINEDYVIKGVNFYDINAFPIGKIGVPDNHTSADSISLVLYPVPCHDVITIGFRLKNKAPLKITRSIIHVSYPGAPANVNINNTDIPVVVENGNLVGNVAIKDSFEIEPPAQQDGSKWFATDVSSLPKGFYKVYIETNTGVKLWDNILKN